MRGDKTSTVSRGRGGSWWHVRVESVDGPSTLCGSCVHSDSSASETCETWILRYRLRNLTLYFRPVAGTANLVPFKYCT